VLLEMKDAVAAIFRAVSSSNWGSRARSPQAKGAAASRADRGHPAVIIKDMARTLKRIRDERGCRSSLRKVLSLRSISPTGARHRDGEIVRDDPRDSVDAAQVSKFLSV